MIVNGNKNKSKLFLTSALALNHMFSFVKLNYYIFKILSLDMI